jgi:hypothetical protein
MPSLASGLTAELLLPALLQTPLRASPPGASFSPTASTLRWERPGGKALTSGLDNKGGAPEPFAAAFLVERPLEAAEEGGKDEGGAAVAAERTASALERTVSRGRR